MAYVLNFGLGPLFNEKLRAQVKNSICITGYFDESTNRVIKQGQMDLHVRFFYPITRLITTSYFNSVFFDRCKAKDLLEHFKLGFAGLPFDKLIQVSMDGPNVNWSFLNKVEQDLVIELSEENVDPPGRFELGSCGLHVGHGAFRSGHEIVNWKVQQALT